MLNRDRMRFHIADDRSTDTARRQHRRGLYPTGQPSYKKGARRGPKRAGGIRDRSSPEGVSKVAVGTSPPWPPSPIALPTAGRGGNRTDGRTAGTGAGAPLPAGGGAMGEGTGVRFQRCGFRNTISSPAQRGEPPQSQGSAIRFA